jgi:hypothetical protein
MSLPRNPMRTSPRRLGSAAVAIAAVPETAISTKQPEAVRLTSYPLDRDERLLHPARLVY